MENWIINYVEKRFPGSKSVIDEAMKTTSGGAVLLAILLALEQFVPGSKPFIDILINILNPPTPTPPVP